MYVLTTQVSVTPPSSDDAVLEYKAESCLYATSSPGVPDAAADLFRAQPQHIMCEKAKISFDDDSRQTLYFSVMLQIALQHTEAMPNFGACCAHDHDCEAADCGPAWSLHENIDQSHVCHISVAMECPTKACLYDPASACVDGRFLLVYSLELPRSLQGG